MIDADGYRPNVGIIICNNKEQVLWAKRFGQNSWQFPQGGIKDGESIEQAMYRELHEEVGLHPQDVKIVAINRGWQRYKLPKRLIRRDSNPVCIGQKQRWFLLQLTCDERKINTLASPSPEFDSWRWVNFWYPVRQVIPFKRDVYRRVMSEFISVMPYQENQSQQAQKNAHPNRKGSYKKRRAGHYANKKRYSSFNSAKSK